MSIGFKKDYWRNYYSVREGYFFIKRNHCSSKGIIADYLCQKGFTRLETGSLTNIELRQGELSCASWKISWAP